MIVNALDHLPEVLVTLIGCVVSIFIVYDTIRNWIRHRAMTSPVRSWGEDEE